MFKYLKIRFWDWVQGNKDVALRYLFLVLPFVYLVNVLFHMFSCRNGLLACGMGDFMVVLPFYLLISQFAGHVNFFTVVLLYLFSSIAYLAAFYYVIAWLQEWRLRVKSRP